MVAGKRSRKRRRAGTSATSRLGPLTKRRFLKSKRQRRRNAVVLPKGVTPRSMRVRLKYNDVGTISGTGGLVGGTIYRCNSIYDPFQPTGGHKARGATDLFNWYNQVTVTGARIVVHFARQANDNPMVVGVRTSAGTTAITDYLYNNTELSRSRYSVMGWNSDSYRVVRQSISLKDFFGKRDIIGSAPYQHTSTTNPTEGAYWHIFVGALDGAATVECDIYVHIEYDCTFTEPRVVDN